eukprot:scaffold778_cov263-Pinguiococcus_pyrenoidosus.AAC.18
MDTDSGFFQTHLDPRERGADGHGQDAPEGDEGASEETLDHHRCHGHRALLGTQRRVGIEGFL